MVLIIYINNYINTLEKYDLHEKKKVINLINITIMNYRIARVLDSLRPSLTWPTTWLCRSRRSLLKQSSRGSRETRWGMR